MSSPVSKSAEIRLAASLGGLVGLRMLGMFIVLPVFMLLAEPVPGYSPQSAGLALGAYGLTQALLQQPLGWLSDRWGRRHVLLIGLALFVLGSAVAALATNMTGLILGRTLQGCGAIAGVAMAMAADGSSEASRPVVMAIIGVGIGFAFLLSLVISVPLANLFGLSGLFWITAILGVLGMGLVLITPRVARPEEQELAAAPRAAAVRQARWLASSVFLLHAVITVLFVALPGVLVRSHRVLLADHWKLYALAMLASVVLVVPWLAAIGRRRSEFGSIPWGFALCGTALVCLSLEWGMAALAVALTVYFLGFNLLEAAMPALLSRLAGARGRGRRLGAYSMFQFLGTFAGGAGGGIVLAAQGGPATIVLAGAASLLWAAVISFTARRILDAGALQGV